MADQRPVKKYPCSQAELYAICTIGWQSYDENLADFSAFSTKYDAQFSIDAKAAIQSAKELPDFQARNEPSETSYKEMVKTVNLCNRNFRKLRNHIGNAFSKDVVKGKVEAAGEPHYKKSMNRNWAETELMLTSATTFITENNADLSAGGMPPQFVLDFDTAKNQFIGYYAAFTDAEQDELEGTDQKINANNAIWDTLTGMFDDGQVIYEDNPAKRERFIVSRVWNLISSSGNTGGANIPSDTIQIGLFAYDSITQLPIQNAYLRVLNAPDGQIYQAATNAEGILTLSVSGYVPGVPAMVQTEIIADGYITVQGESEFTPGQSYSFDVPLDPEPTEP